MISSERDIELADVFVLLADSLRATHDVVDTMDILVQASTRFTSATDAGILLADPAGVLHVVASSNERTSEVEEAQLGYGQGPCLECFTTGLPVEVPDLATEATRWPQFVRLAEARGFQAAHASPLRLRDQVFGAMNLFNEQPGPLGDRDLALAAALTQVATISLVQQQTIHHQATVNDQLQRALDSRVLIEQAKGALAQRHGISVDAAFALLRSHARKNSSRLRDTAEAIVNRRLSI
ncbi:GAF and ANTAR domain-containing protein [Cryobacterium sp. PH29-G1]|uniref:GAF and ANTAR domain-containing protein n=1 Tax=Cryobacterium sp. PH29-G1 TaxID=3046211 RepID=UPI0024BACFC5|nr:GAF and ANTAR domain-containing protein [Cryobacterium sp. PH29-G1]MDJ0350255.1 GAF and ANTAR domain-containing protein [Cryobacterium sp. PH29-G1]